MVTIKNILFNGHNATSLNLLSKSPSKLLSDLSEIKQVSLKDLHSWLTLDHTSFTVLSVSTKHILSTNRLTVTLSKNSAKSFYLAESRLKKSPGSPAYLSAYGPPTPTDNCFQDAQNCTYFSYFNSKEKKLYTRFKDQFEANFLCSCPPSTCSHQHLFLTGTYNTSQQDHYAWTTNWNPSDPCWETLKEKPWLKDWALKFDPQAESMKIPLPPVLEDPTQFATIKKHFAQLIRAINRTFKPSHWKWVVVFELQKKTKNWHWHLFSTPFIPYSHKCVLNHDQTKACWNCRTYLNKLWTYGRVESRSLNKSAAGQYLAKYLSKSFHLREIYAEHGLKDKHRAYHFYHNLYGYERREVSSNIDQWTGEKLNGNQTVFRHYDYQTQHTSYYYRTNKKLVGKRAKPTLIKKNYRLSTRTLNPLSLLKLVAKDPKKELYQFKKPKKTPVSHDFQEFLITRLLALCQTAQFLHLPLEQDQVPKELTTCNQAVTSHFKPQPLLHFTFTPQQAPVIRQFIDQLDSYATEYEIAESQDFFTWPTFHDAAHQVLKKQGSLCGCETQARTTYLNNWNWFTTDYNSVPAPPGSIWAP